MGGELRPVRGNLEDLQIERAPEETSGKPRRKGLVILTSILLGTGAAGVYFWKTAWGLPSVRVARCVLVAPDRAKAILTCSGYVVPRRRATISAQVSGRLVKLHFDEGSIVRAKDLLAEIDPRDYQARANEAKANVADAERELQRQKDLLAGGAGTRQAVDAQQTRLDVFRAQLEAAEIDLQNTKIHAPFDGTVIQKQAEIGEMVSPGIVVSGAISSGAILSLADTEIEIEADINETNLAKVLPGQEAEIVLDAFPERRYRGEIRIIEPKADRQKAVVQARVSIRSGGPELRPEMGAKVTFLSADSGTAPGPGYVQIPRSAVLDWSGGHAVYLLARDRAELRTVEVGTPEGEWTRILKGLSGGEEILLAPPAGLADGDRVRPER